MHRCDPNTAPHELQLCVLESDNSAELNAEVRAMLLHRSRSPELNLETDF